MQGESEKSDSPCFSFAPMSAVMEDWRAKSVLDLGRDCRKFRLNGSQESTFGRANHFLKLGMHSEYQHAAPASESLISAEDSLAGAACW